MPADQGLTDLSEVDLLAKANTAYKLMKVGKNDAPEGLRFVGARKLARGSIVLDLNSTEAVIWLQDKNIREDFIKHFGSMSTVWSREYKILAQFVPILVETDNTETIAQIEVDSGLNRGVIQQMMWAKPPAKCHTNQCVTHLIVYFDSAEAANHVIRNGFVEVAGAITDSLSVQQISLLAASASIVIPRVTQYGTGTVRPSNFTVTSSVQYLKTTNTCTLSQRILTPGSQPQLRQFCRVKRKRPMTMVGSQ
jgi:hypothetical protein